MCLVIKDKRERARERQSLALARARAGQFFDRFTLRMIDKFVVLITLKNKRNNRQLAADMQNLELLAPS